MLEYAYKYREKKDDPAFLNRYKPIAGKGRLPPPPSPRDIDCIITGAPWCAPASLFRLVVHAHFRIYNSQPHSTLNMYKNVNDRKSNLILNLLSWIVFLMPKFLFFENVRGFTHFNLNASQHDKYRVTGGIQAGGVKFLTNSLLALG